MTERDSDRYLTDEQAAQVLGVSNRTVHRYGESGTIRTRKAGRRTMFHAGDVDRLAEDLRVQRRAPDPEEVDQLRLKLEAAATRIGYLEGQLERRLLPDAEMQMRENLIRAQAERDALQARLEAAEARERRDRTIQIVLFVVLMLAIIAFVAYIVIQQG